MRTEHGDRIPKSLLYLDVKYLKEAAKKNNACGLRAKHKLAVLTRDGFNKQNATPQD